MTDREAIRRLASILHARVAGEEEPELVLDWIDRLMVDLAEPPAPMVACAGCGAVVAVKDLLHHDDAQAKPAAQTVTREHFNDIANGRDEPTVTREQAHELGRVIRNWLVVHGGQWRFHDLPTEREMPAFFRTVADQLDKP